VTVDQSVQRPARRLDWERLRHMGVSIWRNPVMVKEIRTRMRGGRAFTVVTVHLLALAVAIGLVYLLFSQSINQVFNLESRRMFGKAIFGAILWMELMTICFTAPALTSGAISSERERQTFDLLRVTLLSPARLVTGKFLSGLVFIFLLIFSSLPLQSLAFIIGGVLAQEIYIAVLILATTAVAFCAVGMFLSSLFSRVLFSTVLSYAFAIFIVFGIPMLALLILILYSSRMNSIDQLSQPAQVLLVFLGWLTISINPGATIVATEAALLDNQGIWMAHLDIARGGTVYMPSPWIAYVVIYLSISLILLILSAARVRRAEA
jgi:ABC-type transport system involved in multi-copper enzyme maturation permease subunit